MLREMFMKGVGIWIHSIAFLSILMFTESNADDISKDRIQSSLS